MIGKLQNTITVQQLYDYAVLHNYLNADATIVLDIINREYKSIADTKNFTNINNVNPVDNTSTIDFNKLVHYTYEDVLALFST